MDIQQMPNLKKEALRILAKRPASITLQEIATKAGVNYEWLIKFNIGKNDPRYSTLQKLYDYLIKQDFA
jgi:predicted transcriptional regulator